MPITEPTRDRIIRPDQIEVAPRPTRRPEWIRVRAPAGAPERRPDATREPGGTTHFVVVDRAGNAVSVTSTIESFFGSGRMVGGFFLNNQLTDFAWDRVDAASVLLVEIGTPILLT